MKIEFLLHDVIKCTLCEKHLAHGVRPILQINSNARILIAGQAPGRKVHESGIPFDDASGDRLRAWMGISKNEFYNSNKIAILPMGFCYPGTGKNGDLPPRPECELTWRNQLLAQLPNIELTLVIGKYAQAYHFDGSSQSVTKRVKSWEKHWPNIVPLPHPSPRNNAWLSKNPWFSTNLLPELQSNISNVLKN